MKFQPGDTVQNYVDPTSKCYHQSAKFVAPLPWYFAEGEEAHKRGEAQGCDVEIEGVTGPYGDKRIVQRMKELRLVEESEVQGCN